MEDMSSKLIHVKDPSSAESSFRELDHVFLQKQAKIWLGEVLFVRFDENIVVADLLADGEVLLQVSKVVWNMYRQQNGETKYCKTLIDEHRRLGKHGRKYMPYLNVDKFLKVCQIFGLTGIDIFSPSDVVEKQDIRRVCMCIRSLSKKARSKHLNVPDFDVVTHNIEMPTKFVDGLRRSLEKALLKFAGPSEHASRRVSIAKYLQTGELDRQDDILAKFYGEESNCGPSEFGSDLFAMLDRNDPLLSDLLSRRWSNGLAEMDESIEMSPCSVLCWEKNSSLDGWESCTLTKRHLTYDMNDLLKNELSESFLSSQENDPSHLLSMDGFEGEITSESTKELHEYKGTREGRQFQPLEVSASLDDPANVSLGVEESEIMDCCVDLSFNGISKLQDNFEVYESKTFSHDKIMETKSINSASMNDQFDTNEMHQEVRHMDGIVSCVNASMSCHLSELDSRDTTNEGVVENDNNDILMYATDSSLSNFIPCINCERNSTPPDSNSCATHYVPKCRRSIDGNQCKCISDSIPTAASHSASECLTGSSIAISNDDFQIDGHCKCASSNDSISTSSDKDIRDLELWAQAAPQHEDMDMQNMLVNDLASGNEMANLSLKSTIENGSSSPDFYADNDANSVGIYSSTSEHQSILDNTDPNRDGVRKILRGSSFLTNQVNQLEIYLDHTSIDDTQSSLETSVEKSVLHADEDAGNCLMASKINVGCSPNLMKVLYDDQTSRIGNLETTNGDNLITDQVVNEDAIEVKSKLQKRLILGSFAGGAVFGVLFFVYQISKRRLLKGGYYRKTEGKKRRPISYKHRKTANMGQQKPKEAAVYPGERLTLKR